jgi:O-acetylserine/cysteine efflux transporter
MGITVALTWGMGIVFAKAAIAHFPPILLMAFRFSVTALVLVWFVKPPLEHLRNLVGIAFISAAVQYSLTFSGLKGLDASVAALLIQLEVPLLSILGVLALGEATNWRKWIGIFISFVGVALIAGEPKTASAIPSVLLVLGGSLSWATGQILVRKLKDIDGITLTAWIAVLAAPQLFVMSLIFEDNQIAAIQSAGLIVWAAVAYLGLVMTAFGYWLWYGLVRAYPVSQIAPFLLLLPVFSVLGGIIFLGEALSTQTIIGGSIIIAGVAFVMLQSRES